MCVCVCIHKLRWMKLINYDNIFLYAITCGYQNTFEARSMTTIMNHLSTVGHSTWSRDLWMIFLSDWDWLAHACVLCVCARDSASMCQHTAELVKNKKIWGRGRRHIVNAILFLVFGWIFRFDALYDDRHFKVHLVFRLCYSIESG